MRLIVIGGVAAGMSAASRARRADSSLEIVVLEKGAEVSYGACGLPYLIEGRLRRAEDLVVHPPAYFERERGITVRTNTEVTAISHARRQVALAGGERLRYDRLVLATGARPDRSGVAGADLPHVFTLHTLDDARRLQEFLRDRRPRRAVVIGAGYIGLEMADALRANGLRVTVFEASPHVLGREDPELTLSVRTHLEKFGVDLRLLERVTRVEADRVSDVACDLVLLAAGFLPNVELGAEAGVATGRTGAFRVSEHMETNLAGVFAAGDCAETMHLVTGAPAYIPLGTTANKSGRVAGANAAGKRERFPGVTGTSLVRVCGLAVGISGLSAGQARKAGFDPVSARVSSLDRPRYFFGRRVTVDLVADRGSGRLLGGTVTGEEGVAGRVNVIATALQARMSVEDLTHLDLAYTPPYATVLDPLLIAARELGKRL